mgnify:FL=1
MFTKTTLTPVEALAVALVPLMVTLVVTLAASYINLGVVPLVAVPLVPLVLLVELAAGAGAGLLL